MNFSFENNKLSCIRETVLMQLANNPYKFNTQSSQMSNRVVALNSNGRNNYTLGLNLKSVEHTFRKRIFPGVVEIMRFETDPSFDDLFVWIKVPENNTIPLVAYINYGFVGHR